MKINEFEYPIIIPLLLTFMFGILGAVNFYENNSIWYFVGMFLFLIIFGTNLPHTLENISKLEDNKGIIKNDNIVCKCGHEKHRHIGLGEKKPKICLIWNCKCKKYIPQERGKK